MSRQLELDINRPTWAETDYRSEVKDLWSVRGNKSTDKNPNVIDSESFQTSVLVNNEQENSIKEL